MGNFVSVILPVGDEISYLEEAVESIAEQTYKNIELIVIDSSMSPDRVKAILKPYGDMIRYIYQEKSGIANALNLGIEEANGKYIARMDADDISFLNRIATQVEYLEHNTEVDVLATAYDVIEKNGEINELQSKHIDYETLKAKLIFENPIAHPSVMFRAKLFENGWRYNNVHSEDLDLWIRMAKFVKIEILDEKLLLYRHHAQNAVVTTVEKVIDSSISSTREYLSLLFGMNTDKYRNEDLTKNYYLYKLRGDCDSKIQDCILRQYDLLQEILEVNKKLKIIDEKILENEIYRRWDLVTLLLPRFEDSTQGNWNPNRVLNECNRDWLKYRDANMAMRDLNVKKEDIASYLIVNDNLRRDFFAVKARFVLYGIGDLGRRTIHMYECMKETSALTWDMIAVVDRIKLKYMLMGNECETITVDELLKHDFDYVVISSDKFYAEIRDSLLAAGVGADKILDNLFI